MSSVSALSASGQSRVQPVTSAASHQEYFKDLKTLKTFFVSGEIPTNFPKYDSAIDKAANKELVKKWISEPENNALLTLEMKDKFAKRMQANEAEEK